MTIHLARTVHAAQLRQRRAATKLIALAALLVLGPIGAALAQKAEGPPGSAQNQPTAPSSTGAVGDTTVSRFVAVRVDTGGPGALSEAFSRPMSVRSDTLPAFAYTEAIGRPLTVRIDTAAAPLGLEVYSRPFAARSDTLTAPFSFTEAFTRQLSVLTDTSSTSALITEAYSRPFTVRSDTLTAPFSFTEAITRPFAVRSDTLGTLFAYAQAFTRQLSVLATRFVPVAASCATNSISFHWASVPSFNFYRVYISTAPTNAAVIDSISVGSDTTATYATGLIDGVRYYARVAGSANGGATFDPFSVFNSGTLIDRTTPSASVPVLALTEPTSNTLHVGLSGSDLGTPLSFRLQVATDATFAVATVDTLLPGGVQETTIAVARGSTLYARCKVTDCAGNESTWSAASEGVFIANLPDLAVIAVTGAPSGTSGSTVGLSWQIQNLGTGGTTVSSWIERVYLSPDSLLSELTPLGNFPSLSYLLGGESYGRSATVTLPRGISGNYYLVVLVDAANGQPETNEANNRGRSLAPTVVTLQDFADLRVTNVGAGDFAIAGDSVSVVWTVKNVGTRATEVPNWLDRIFISEDSTLTYVYGSHSDNVVFVAAEHLGDTPHNGLLAPQAQYTASARFKVPYPLTSGPYYVAVATDWGYSDDRAAVPITWIACAFEGNVYEYNEELANWRSDATNISLPPTPDLHVTLVQPPAQVTAGELANVTWTVDNAGGGNPFEFSWFDRVYISASPQFNLKSATALGDFIRLSGSPANASAHTEGAELQTGPFPYTKTVAVRIPNGTQGQNYFHVFTDPSNGVFENGADSNNVGTSSVFNVTLPQSPDFRLDFVTSTTTGRAGDSTSVIYQVSNVGTPLPSGASWSDQIRIVRLDENSQPIAGSDRALKSATRTLALGTGTTYQPQERVLLPTDLVAGSYAIKVSVDQTEAIYENVPEAINTAVGQPVSVQAYPTVDLIVDQVSPVGSSAIAGDSLTVTWHVKNIGAAKTLTSWWTDAVYFSTDNQLDAGDEKLTVLGKAVIAALGPNEGYNRTLRVPTPRDWGTTAFLLVKTDNDTSVAESAEGNNTGSSGSISIQLPAPVDLRVDSIDPPAVLTAGQPAQITWTVSNHGTGSTPTNAWYDELYLSSKPFLDGTAIRLKQLRGNRLLTAGAAYTDTAQVQIPNYLSGGQFLIARVDAIDEIYEVGTETNNLTTKTVSVAGQPLTDLVVSSISFADSALAGNDLLVGWSLGNNGPGTVSGLLQQGVFLSLDDAWDASDLLLGIVNSTTNIAPGPTSVLQIRTTLRFEDIRSAAQSIVHPIPGVTPNNYRLIVRTDLSNAFRETRKDNNTSASTTHIAIDLNVLPIGIPIANTVRANSWSYYSVALPRRGDWKFSAFSDSLGVPIRAYWDSLAVPSSSQFAIESGYSIDAATMTLADTGPGRFFLALQTGSPSGEGIAQLLLHLSCVELPLNIERVEPPVVGAGARVTMNIAGSRLFTDASVRLRHSGSGQTISPISVKSTSSLNLRSTWDLSLSPTGLYDLVVLSRGDTAMLERCVTVETATGYVLEDHSRYPDVVRIGGSSNISMSYKNIGNVDVPFVTVSLFVPSNTQLTGVAVSPDVISLNAEQFDIKSLSNNGPRSRPEFDEVESEFDSFHRAYAIMYDIAPQEQRSVHLSLSSGAGDLFRGSTYTNIVDPCGFSVMLASNAEELRALVRDSPLDYTPAVVVVAEDSVAFFAKYLDMLWGYQDTTMLSVIKNACGGGSLAPTYFESAQGGGATRTTGPANILTTFPHSAELPGRVDNGRQSHFANRAMDALPTPCVKCGVPEFGSCESLGRSPLTGNGLCRCYTVRPPGRSLCTPFQYSLASATLGLAQLSSTVTADGRPPGQFQPALPDSQASDIGMSHRWPASGALRPASDVARTCVNLGPDEGCHCEPLVGCVCRPLVAACDPNELDGPAGNGQRRWVTVNIPLEYQVRFENDPKLATAPARQVTVTCDIPSTVDPRSVRLSRFGLFGNEVSIPEGRNSYSTRLDLTQSRGVLVDVVANVDFAHHALVWQFLSIDPLTGQEPVDPLVGFLAVNDSLGSGTGHVDFSVSIASGVPTGTGLDLGADIVFDTNPAVATNRAQNTIDAVVPTSHMSALPSLAEDSKVDLWWTTSDDSTGSGVASVALYSAKDGGAFGLMVAGLSAPPYQFVGETGHLYSFYTVAQDTAGNSEGAKNVAEASVLMSGAPIVWPGDTNNDGIVDELDVLPLGRYFDFQGPARDSLAVTWVPREAVRWDSVGATYADANGDGRVTQNDLLAVGLNFGKVRPSAPVVHEAGAIAEISLGEFKAGVSVAVQVDLDAMDTSEVVGGAGLQFSYPAEFLEPESVTASAAGGDDVFTLMKADAKRGRCSVGLAGKGDAAQRLLGRDGHLALTLNFRTKSVPPKGATVSVQRCKALVGRRVTGDVTVSLSSDFAVDRPGSVQLLQNTPNPFATRTVLQFELPKAGEVSLHVFDVAGRLVALPIDRARMTAGIHQVGIDGRNWVSGIYFTELRLGSQVRTRKMLLMR